MSIEVNSMVRIARDVHPEAPITELIGSEGIVLSVNSYIGEKPLYWVNLDMDDLDAKVEDWMTNSIWPFEEEELDLLET